MIQLPYRIKGAVKHFPAKYRYHDPVVNREVTVYCLGRWRWHR